MKQKSIKKRKVSDELVISKYIETQSYKKTAGLLKCTVWNVRKAIQNNRDKVPELAKILANQHNNLQSYYDYKRTSKPNNEPSNNKSNTYMATDITAIDKQYIDNDLPSLPDDDDDNIPAIHTEYTHNIDNISSINNADDDEETINANLEITRKIDAILDETLKKLKKAIKTDKITAKDYSEIINKLISRKLDLVATKKGSKTAQNVVNIWGSPAQAAKLLREMQKISKKMLK